VAGVVAGAMAHGIQPFSSGQAVNKLKNAPDLRRSTGLLFLFYERFENRDKACNK
jgi:hypothetical protein